MQRERATTYTPTVFNIEFVTDVPEPQEEGWLGLWGRVTLGDYSERFLAPIGDWQRGDYERQWLEAARRLLGDADRTGFFTVPHAFWWIMWRAGTRVFVQEAIITPERYAALRDAAVPYDIIENRTTCTEDGDLISEWEVSLDDVRDFVNRRQTSAAPA